MEEGEGDLTSDKADLTEAWPSDLRDAILKPLKSKITPNGDPAAKKF